MVVWSTLRPFLQRSSNISAAVKRCMSEHRIFPYQPSRWQWRKFKDYFHLYICIGVIPLTIITTSANIFVGPATLCEIPEGYEPKYWEYYRSPITRFIAKYFMRNPQQEYEKYLHHIYEENEKRVIRKLEREVKHKISERNDYQIYYYQPVMSKYHRIIREAADKMEEIRGD